MGTGRRRALLLLGAVVSVNASYTVLIPFVPDLEGRVGAGPVTIALMFALFAAAKSLFQPAGGWWVDRWRPGPVACVALNIAAAGIVLTAFAPDPGTLLAGRFLWGIGEGVVTPALYAGMAALCRVHGLSTSRMMGNFGSVAVVGFLLGPLVAGLAAPFGLASLFLAGAAATSLTAFGLLRAIPDVPAEPPAVEPDRPQETKQATRWWVWVLLLGVLDLFTHLVYTALEPLLPLYLASGTDSSARGAISVVLVIGLATSAAAMWAIGRWTERAGLVRLVAAGLGCLAAGLALMALRPAVVTVAAAFVVVMVGYAILYLSARRGIVELKSAAGSEGKAFGLFGLVSDVGNVLGPLAGVLLYELTGRVSFLLLGMLSGLLLAVLVAGACTRRNKRLHRADSVATPGEEALTVAS